MWLVHCHATKAPLPEMPGPPPWRMDAPGISAVQLRQRAVHRVGVVGHQNQMNMVGHQHPRPHRHPVCGALYREQIAVSAIVVGGEKTLLPPIAALCHMVRNSSQNEAGKTRHAPILPTLVTFINLVHGHRDS